MKKPQSRHAGAFTLVVASLSAWVAVSFAGPASTEQSAQNSATSTAKDPATLTAHDAHQEFLVAADPWVNEENYRARFGKKNPYSSGIVAIDAYFRNDSNKPVQVKLEDVRLTLAAEDQPEQDLPPLGSREVASDILQGGGRAPRARRLPVPIGVNHGKDWEELEGKLHAAMIQSDVVGAHTTVHGLLYFDLEGQFDALKIARLYVPDLRFIGSSEALIYFDVSLSGPKKQ